MKVRDIMTTGVETAAPDSSLKEIAILMRDEDVGAIPIVESEELTGIITDRDIVVRCIAAGNDPAETEAGEIVSEELVTVGGDDDVQEAVRIMADHQVRRLPVVESGRLVGMVSLGDIAVKESESSAGDALENISEGVRGRSRAGKLPPQPAQVGGDRGKVQAISNRARGEEMERQQRVNPQRAASGGKRRRTG
jgi:CBS domain-containing protein